MRYSVVLQLIVIALLCSFAGAVEQDAAPPTEAAENDTMPLAEAAEQDAGPPTETAEQDTKLPAVVLKAKKRSPGRQADHVNPQCFAQNGINLPKHLIWLNYLNMPLL